MVKNEKFVVVAVDSKIGSEKGGKSQYRGKVTIDGFGALNPGTRLVFEGPDNLPMGVLYNIVKKSGVTSRGDAAYKGVSYVDKSYK